jgi:hypothetical protein
MAFKDAVKNIQAMAYNGVHTIYHKVASTSPSCLEAHDGFFRLSVKEKFDVCLL